MGSIILFLHSLHITENILHNLRTLTYASICLHRYTVVRTRGYTPRTQACPHTPQQKRRPTTTPAATAAAADSPASQARRYLREAPANRLPTLGSPLAVLPFVFSSQLGVRARHTVTTPPQSDNAPPPRAAVSAYSRTTDTAAAEQPTGRPLFCSAPHCRGALQQRCDRRRSTTRTAAERVPFFLPFVRSTE